MSFADSVKSGFTNWKDFRGVARRPAFWYFRLFIFLVTMVASTVDGVIAKGIGANADTFVPFQLIVSLFLLVPDLSVTFRRLHDAGHSAHWLWINVIPVAIGVLTLPRFIDAALNGTEPTSLGVEATVWLLIFLSSLVTTGVVMLTLLVQPTKTFEHGNRFAKPANLG